MYLQRDRYIDRQINSHRDRERERERERERDRQTQVDKYVRTWRPVDFLFLHNKSSQNVFLSVSKYSIF